MPRPRLPPTPASSTDISGKDHSRLSSLETSFSLPPPALAGSESARSASASTTNSSSESSYHPASPTSHSSTAVNQAKSRARPSSTLDDFSLPPPPTRSRKIIQMKPKRQEPEQPVTEDAPAASKASTKSKAVKNTVSPAGGPNKRKQPSSTSVAGRKIARKTAHSLIERRRRSKMNEEFGVLKDMIPACKDEEMHKLAILQASIDYLRYLEHCVSNLKAANQNNHSNHTPTPNSRVPTPTPHHLASASHSSDTENENEDVEDQDLEMPDSAPIPPSIPDPFNHHAQDRNYTAYSSSSTTTSPALDPQHGKRERSYSYTHAFHSTLPSPAFAPLNHNCYPSYVSPHSASTSPNLVPLSQARSVSQDLGMRSTSIGDANANAIVALDVDGDHEATAALLMLNTDRRGLGAGMGSMARDWDRDRNRDGGRNGERERGRGMSVRDLLSA